MAQNHFSFLETYIFFALNYNELCFDVSVTFEDKRKENFEKGQAELDRRRKALLEIQRKEQEERERKEREEREKQEKIRYRSLL